MEILLTGFTAFLTQEWIETAFPNDHVLTTCAKGEALSDTQIKTVTLESRQLLDQLAETYQFDRVVYFSEYLLPHGDQEGELDRLRRVLQSCREREVELLYLSGPEAAFAPSTGKTLLANAAEELCFHYARTSKLQVKVFRLPYLYAVSASGADQFARLFEQMPAGTVQMDEQAAQPLLALCAEELADLVARVFDTWTPEPERFTLPDVFGNTQGQLGEVLQKLQPGLKVLYGTDTIQTYPAADNAVRRRYGWFQRYSILDDLPAIYNAWCARKTEKKSFIRKMVDKIRRSSLLLRLVEIAAAWLFSHWQAKGRVYIAVIHYVGTEAGDDIVRALGRIKYAVKSKTMRGENTEMAVEVFCKDPNMEFADRIRAVKGGQDVTLIQYNGEYHG